MTPSFDLSLQVRSPIAALLTSGALRAIRAPLVVGVWALQGLPPVWAEAVAPASAPDVARTAALASLALPACRAALGLQPAVPAEELLRSDRALAATLARTPACQSPAAALARLDQLERELAASRQRIAQQKTELERETDRQEALAKDLAQIRSQLIGQASPSQGTGPQVPLSAPATPTAPVVATGSASAPTPADPAAPAVPTASAAAAAPTDSAAAAPPATPVPTPAPALANAAPEPVSFTPGKGVTLRSGDYQLRLWAEAKLLGFSSSRYVFNPGQPLVVSPKDPDAAYDLSAQQSMVYAAFQGPKWGAWTPGGFALFTLQDNLLAEGYSFTPIAFYGEISDGHWRIVAGQNFDVFAPRDPDTIPTGKLAATGNPGAYRPQFRLERSFEAGPSFGGIVQLAAASPITTALPDEVDVANLQTEEVVEDNGWPNVEGRISLGFGETTERAGGRRLRPVELGVSGVVGQLRVLDNIRPTDPLTLAADRSLVSVWGAAFDGQIALGRNFGLSGELYTGQGLGEYMAGIFQTYNRVSNKAVPTSGGWGQIYVYPAENLRLAAGYGIDHATDSGVFGLQANSTIFANAVWDVNAWLQLGLEGNYKLTTYDSFGDKEAWVVISEVMFRL
ncbi:MAG: hypothetical protein ACK6DG_02570 [Cyanobacteriota bacterium]